MKKSELTKKDIQYISEIHGNTSLSWNERMNILSDYYNVSERTIRKWISQLNIKKKDLPISEEYKQALTNKYDNKKKRFIITWAQNATPVHLPFLKNIEKYANFIDAEIIVIAGRYKNPTSQWSENNSKDEWWAKDIQKYLYASRLEIHRYLSIVADLKIQPTATEPLMGLEGITGDKTSIFGHPRLHLEPLPVLEGHSKKIMCTTGACTLPNYTDSKAGKKGEFHHTYGFVIVEIEDDKYFYIRQVSADLNGNFIDLIYNVENGNIIEETTCKAYVYGDLHLANANYEVIKATREKLFRKIHPEYSILHDIFDGETINHHEEKNPFKKHKLHVNFKDSLENELQTIISFLTLLILRNEKPVIVRSNHDEWLDKWLINGDWKKDPSKMLTYISFVKAILEKKAPKGILPYVIENSIIGDKVICLSRDESFKIGDWELANHGDLGFNGSRGNLEQYRKLNTKVVVGDYHKPIRRDGALSVGTYSKLRMGYNTGPSSWLNAGVIIHNNNKAQHIIFINNNFTTLF